MRFAKLPFVFQVAREQVAPSNWRVLFIPDLAIRITNDRRVPTVLREDANVPSAGSWVLSRLAALVGDSEALAQACRCDNGEALLDFSISDTSGEVAVATMHLSREEARLVGRTRRAELESSIRDALLEALFEHGDELGSVRVTIGDGVDLGFDGKSLAGGRPHDPDTDAILDAIIEGRAVERLADDRVGCCPVTTAQLLRDYVETSGQRTSKSKRKPTIVYLQSFRAGDWSGWAFRVTPSRYAVVVATGNSRDTYAASADDELVGVRVSWHG